jgi:amino acid transporter
VAHNPEVLEGRLKKDIGRLGFGMLNLNSIIGAGIFGLPAVAAAQAGDFSPWMFAICGVLTMTLVLSFARASSLVTATGGIIVYASRAFGPFIGFQTGWLSWLSRVAAMGANTNLLVTYCAWFWAPLDDEPWRSITLVAVIGALTWLNMVGLRKGMATLYVLTLLKLLPLSLLILLGLGHVDAGDLFGATFPGIDGLGGTILVLLYAYVGFEGTTVNAGEGRDPRRDLPRALIQTVVIIGVIYFLVQVVCDALLPDLAATQTPLADAAAVLFGATGATVMTLGAVFSIGGNLSGSILSAPRMTWALARDGSLPAWLAAVHERWQTPHRSILLYGVLCTVLALSGGFIWLAMMATLIRLIAYLLCIAALPKLAARARAEGSDEAAFDLPGGMVIPAVAFILCLWLITQAPPKAWLVTAGFAVMGSLLYYWSRRKQ